MQYFAVILQLFAVKKSSKIPYIWFTVNYCNTHCIMGIIFIKFTVIYCICEFAVFYCLHKSSSATVNEEDRLLACAADILIGLKHYIYI